MFLAARRIVAVYTAFVLAWTPGKAADAAMQAPVASSAPSISFVGGSAERRQTVVQAADRYRSAGLQLPDLEIHFHDGKTGCRDMQGLFRPNGAAALIDLCYDGEFLALHEL